MTSVRVLVGDAIARLKELPDESVHACVTSPPYWGLRDYGHEGQIGLEERPETYVARLVDVFAEVRRVMRQDGSLWLNLGDSYVGARCGGQGPGGQLAGRAVAKARANVTPEKRAQVYEGPAGRGHGLERGRAFRGRGRGARRARDGSAPELPPKSLVGIPWRVAFALQADGWLLRADNIWAKPSCMPESVPDRPTRSHEYVFLLAPGRRYFYDSDAVRTPLTDARSVIERNPRPGVDLRGGQRDGFITQNAAGAAVRTVWTIPTSPSGIEHFATMPPALAERCILLGTSAGGACSSCGAPLERRVELGQADLEHQRACGGDVEGAYEGTATKGYAAAGVQDPSAVKARILAGMRERKTVGWDPTCSCPPAPPARCVVLDPFGGAGTTALVAARLQRDAIIIELNPAYAELARARVAEDLPLLTSVEVA